jgi:hypothetical protein
MPSQAAAVPTLDVTCRSGRSTSSAWQVTLPTTPPSLSRFTLPTADRMKNNTPDVNLQVCGFIFGSSVCARGHTNIQRGVIVNTASIAAMDGQVRPLPVLPPPRRSPSHTSCRRLGRQPTGEASCCCLHLQPPPCRTLRQNLHTGRPIMRSAFITELYVLCVLYVLYLLYLFCSCLFAAVRARAPSSA